MENGKLNLVGQVVALRPSNSGGWGIVVSTSAGDGRRFFAHNSEFLDGPPEVGWVVAFTVAEPCKPGQLPRARGIRTVAVPERKPKRRTKTS
jgi:hypothetical protein